MPDSINNAETAGLTENVAGALCYSLGFLTGIAFLVMAPYNTNRNIRFHAFQSIFFNVGMLAFSIALSIVGMILPSAIRTILGLASMAVSLGFLLGWLFLMWKTYQGATVVLPVVGPFAQRYSNR